nr:8751_t:CDS:2 [Entrophospora candida]CAG8604733.1 13804_t:CDS:2 [Entrophospora candida]
MKYQSVIVKLFSGLNPICLYFPTVAKTTIFDLKQIIFGRLLIDPDDQKLVTISGKYLKDSTRIFENDDVEFTTLTLKLPLYGGKGGFGSMLRAQGGKMASQKTTNFEACRDLNGRRLRTVNEAKRLADLLEKEPERERVRNDKIQRKIENGLKERQAKKIRFDDTEFLKQSEEMKEKVQVAVTEAVKNTTTTADNTTTTKVVASKNTTATATPTKSIHNNAFSMWDVEMTDSSDDDAEMTESDA